MKFKVLVIAAVLAVCVQGAVFAKGIIEERAALNDYDALSEQVNACIETGDYAAAIPLLRRMHDLKPGELIPVEYLGLLYIDLPEERPALTNALFWLTEAEKRGSSNNSVYYNLACVYSLRGELEKAEEEIDKAIVLGWSNFEDINQDDDLVNFRTGSWWEGIADNYTRIEQLLAEFNEFDTGEEEINITGRITFYGGIVTALKELAPHIPALQFRPLFFLVSSYEGIKNYAFAEQNYLEARAILEKVLGKEHPYYATMANNVEKLYKNMSDYATTLNNMGALYWEMGDYTKAESCYLEDKAITEKVLGKEHPSYATTLNNLGALYKSMGDYAKAESCYLEARTIYEKVLGKEHPSYATTLNNLGRLYHSMGDYSKAESCFFEDKAITEKVLGKEHPSYATTVNNMGLLYKNMGDYAKAKSCYLEARTIYEKALGKEHPSYATTLNNLGALYYSMGDYAKAESCFLEDKAITEKVLGKDHPNYAGSLNNLGWLYYSMGDYADAESCYLESRVIMEKALGKEHPDYATALDNLYALYLSKKEYMQALTYKQEQIKINTSLVNQNFSFQTEQQRTAYWDANSFSFEISYSLSFFYPVPASNVLNYDNALFSKGLLLRTTNAVRDAIYASGNQALITQFEDLGRKRQQISVLRQSGGDEVYIQSLEAQAEVLEKSLTQSSREFREFKADLVINWQNIQNSLQQGEAAIEFVSFRLFDKKRADTVHYAALMLKPNSTAPVWVPLCNETELQGILGRANVKEASEQTRIIYDIYGADLYSLIWEPLEKELENVKTIYYSPSGLLHKIAFGALPTGEDDNDPAINPDDLSDEEYIEYLNKDSKRLADRYDLNLVSSTREVAHLSRNKTETIQVSSAVLYGGLDYNTDEETMRITAQSYGKDGGNGGIVIASALPAGVTRGGVWNYLPATRIEAQNIQGYLDKKRLPYTLYTDSLGNEESFKGLDGKKTGLIHMATHGFFLADVERRHEEREQQKQQRGITVVKAAENPLLRSGLLLAGGNHAWTDKPVQDVEDGILYADEISGINLLGAKLVVMSACQTGLGDVNNGEGVFGLQRAFKLAGVETLIMSLWEVDDAATAKLMSVFYQEWLFSGKGRKEAFKEAQRQVRAEFKKPYYWAAFVMMD